MAGTVESNVSSGSDPAALLKGYRGAFYLGIGLSGLALVIALSFCFHDFVSARKHKNSNVQKQEEKSQA